MPLTSTLRGTLSAATSKVVAASQKWRCAQCDELLPSSYQVDHRHPLWDGGSDTLDNLQALCPNCHATKTQKESIARRLSSERSAKQYDYETRNDVVIDGKFQCSECLQIRPMTQPHSVCWVIERKYASHDRTAVVLSKFAFSPPTAT